MEMRTITLVTNHTHAGVQYYPGQQLMLPEEDAELLANMVVRYREELAAQASLIPGSPEYVSS